MSKVRPHAVTPLDNYSLLIEFDNGEKRLLDVKPFISGSWYGMLSDNDYFRTVRISDNTATWADGQDIAPHELYELSVPV